MRTFQVSANARHVICHGDSMISPWPAGDTLFFDPPWQDICTIDVPVENYGAILAFCDGQRSGDIVRKFGPPSWVFVWDCLSSWVVPGKPLKRAKLCFAYFDRWITSEAVFIQRLNVPRVVRNSKGEYIAGDARGVRISDVYSAPITALHSGSAHSHSKPRQWLAYLIAGVTPAGGIVVDPFAGSFSAAAAAESVGINSWSCEIGDFDIADVSREIISSAAPTHEQFTLV